MSPITGYVSGCLGSVQAGLDAATNAWVAAVITNGGSVSAARQLVVNSLIVGLKADGLFSKLDRLWLLAAENTPSALTDLIATALATAVNSPSFTTDRGYTGVDASSTIYIDTGFNPTSGTPQYTQNAAHVSAWGVTDVQSSASGGAIVGLYSGSSQTYILPWYSDGNSYNGVNGSQGLATVGHSTGHWCGSRTANNVNSFYRNGSSILAINNSTVALLNGNFYMLLRNDTGTGPDTGSGVQCAEVSMGGGLTATDVTNFYNRLRTYMTAVGVP